MPDDMVKYEAAGGVGAAPCRLKRFLSLGSNACNPINRPN